MLAAPGSSVGRFSGSDGLGWGFNSQGIVGHCSRFGHTAVVSAGVVGLPSQTLGCGFYCIGRSDCCIALSLTELGRFSRFLLNQGYPIDTYDGRFLFAPIVKWGKDPMRAGDGPDRE